MPVPFREIYGSGTVQAAREKNMLWTIIVILIVMWALGFLVGGESVGSLIHLLLVIAAVVLVIQLITGRRAA